MAKFALGPISSGETHVKLVGRSILCGAGLTLCETHNVTQHRLSICLLSIVLFILKVPNPGFTQGEKGRWTL